MKKQGTGNREEGTERRLERLLRQSVARIQDEAELDRDLWPAMLHRLEERRKVHVPWFDWVLAGGLAALLAVFPAWIPVLLYYL
jgi:type VI protein secretion system component VasF